MTYNDFKNKVAIIGDLSGTEVSYVTHDKESGKFFARFKDDTILTMASSGTKATVRFGSGHIAMAEI